MIIAQSARLVGGKRLKTRVSIEGGYIWSSCFHFTLVSESGFLDPGHNHYRRLISIMPLSALSPVPDFLLWSPSSYYNPTFLLSSDSVFSTKNAPKLQKQFPSMTMHKPTTVITSYARPSHLSSLPPAFISNSMPETEPRPLGFWLLA